jgi:low temperature requirement protein LtrA
MRGRDPRQPHRASTPLELLFDLTFVIAYGSAANELAHFLAVGHFGAGIGGFLFAIFAISWAWINFSWFASAYDTDDWLFRLTTMVQMGGVLVLGLGLPVMFESLEHGVVDNRVMVLGYVVMRVPMIAQWARAAHQDPRRRRNSEIRIGSIVLSQIGWCLLLLVRSHLGLMFALAAIPLAIELYAPIVAERKYSETPWHPHHIAERYGLVVMIALGEGLVGTMATLAAIVGPQGPGWTLDVALVGLAGTAMTFGMWWIYFVIPSGALLGAHRDRSVGWGYGHMVLFAATVGVGAGLHVAALTIERHSMLSVPATLLCAAVPLSLYVASVFALYWALTRSCTRADIWMLVGTALTIAAAIALACAGVSIAWSLSVLALAPWVTVVGYEAVGHRHNEKVIRAAMQAE